MKIEGRNVSPSLISRIRELMSTTNLSNKEIAKKLRVSRDLVYRLRDDYL